MDRRQFIEGGLAISVLSGGKILFPGEAKARVPISDKVLLNSFLHPLNKNNIGLTRRDIELSLFDIENYYGSKYGSRTTGRAVRLGGNLFLTANHVIKNKRNQRLVPQILRHEEKRYSSEFNVLAADNESDIALLRGKKWKKSLTPRIYLSKEPNVGHDLSYFLRATRTKPFQKDRVFSLKGRDLYNKKSTIGLGRLVLHKGTKILEKEGFSLEYRAKEIDKIYREIALTNGEILGHANLPEPKYDGASTLLFELGDSGGPVFKRMGLDKYGFIGLAKEIIIFPNQEIITLSEPGREIKRKTHQKFGFYVNGKAIKKLIGEYLNI
jgi:hypothetical protein